MCKSQGLKDGRAWLSFSDQRWLSTSALTFANNMLIFTCLLDLLPSPRQRPYITLRFWKENACSYGKYCFIWWVGWSCGLSYGYVCAVKPGAVQDPWSPEAPSSVTAPCADPEGLSPDPTVLMCQYYFLANIFDVGLGFLGFFLVYLKYQGYSDFAELAALCLTRWYT